MRRQSEDAVFILLCIDIGYSFSESCLSLHHFLIATIMSGTMADITDSSPLSVVVLSPEFVVGLVHEHAILKEHDVQDPPEAEQEWQNEEELPVGP